jgi:hypothetical protein
VVRCTGNEGLKSIDEARLAVVQRANPAHGLLPLGGQSRGPITISGPLKIEQRRLVVFALLGVNDAHSLRAPKARGKTDRRERMFLGGTRTRSAARMDLPC